MQAGNISAISWLLVIADGTCSEEGYNTQYRRDGDGRTQTKQSVGVAEFRKLDQRTTRLNISFCKRFYQEARLPACQKKWVPGGGLAGGWVNDTAAECTAWLAVALQNHPKARIGLIGHSRGGMVAVLIAKWLQARDREVDFLGLYDAVDRAPNLAAAAKLGSAGLAFGGSLGALFMGAAGMLSDLGMDTTSIPSNVKIVRHAIRRPDVGSRWWFGNTATEWNSGAASKPWKRHFRASHGALGGSVPHELPAQAIETFKSDSAKPGQAISEQANTSEGAAADRWIREGARVAGLPI